MNLDEQIYSLASLDGRFDTLPPEGPTVRFCSSDSYGLEIRQVIDDGQILSTEVTHNGVLVYSADGPSPSEKKRKSFLNNGWTKDIAAWSEAAEHRVKSELSNLLK